MDWTPVRLVGTAVSGAALLLPVRQATQESE